MNELTLKGECIGVELEIRPDDGHVLFRLLVEDDGSWFPLQQSVSSYWLDETISVLTSARVAMKDGYEERKWGYYRALARKETRGE